MSFLRLLTLFSKNEFQKDHADYYTDESKRITDCASYRHLIGRVHSFRINFQKRLLCGSQHRRIGGSSCQESDADRQRNISHHAYDQRHRRSKHQNSQRQEIQPDTAFLQ